MLHFFHVSVTPSNTEQPRFNKTLKNVIYEIKVLLRNAKRCNTGAVWGPTAPSVLLPLEEIQT